MPPKPEAPTSEPFTPERPILLALALLTAWVLLLCLPMFGGGFLVGPASDQIWTGVPFRWFGGEEWRRTGSIPLWNPYMFGGLPFVGAMHGDIFYPTAWLRLILPVDTAMNLGFAAHYVLAGFFAYLFLRSLDLSWTAALVGGLGYQLCGVVASLARPGHDGKLFVSALLPLMLLSLVIAVRRRRPEGYGLLALAVGLGIISPQIPLMQYVLLATGLFALYLAFWADDRPERPAQRFAALGLALAAVALGFGLGMIQLWPFVGYLPFSARYAGAQGWEYATSYAMPWPHVMEWLVPGFTGSKETYWSENPLKYHSEYLGVATLVLATIGAADPRRRKLLWFLGAAWLLFVLVSLGAHTPFYRLWYALVPGAKSTRAPAMAFVIPSLITAVVAAVGVERLQRGEGKRALYGWLIGAGALLLLGASGALSSLAESLAIPERLNVASAHGTAIALGTVKSAVFAAATAGVGLAMLAGRLQRVAVALMLAAVVGADLFLSARPFWEYSPRAAQLYADDPVTQRLRATPVPYRVLDLPEPASHYPTAFLMGKRIPAVLGHHGNELHRYDELLGGKNLWRSLFPRGSISLQDLAQPANPGLWDLLAIGYVILPAPQLPLPGYTQVAGPATTPNGQTAYLYARDSVPPYARVVAAAAKVPDEQAVPTLLDPRLDVSRVLLLPEDAPIEVPRLDSMPPPSRSRARVTAWEPGRMTIRLDPAPEADAWLLVSENWYPDWQAEVDGHSVPTLRGDYTFLAVRLPPGAREVGLRVSSSDYRNGRLASAASLTLIGLWIVAPVVARRRRRG